MNYFKTPSKSELDLVIKEHEAKIKSLEAELAVYKGKAESGQFILPRKHTLPNTQYVITDNTGGKLERGIGTRGSQNTSAILESLEIKNEQSEGQLKAEKFITVFNAPSNFSEYLQSEDFADDLMTLCVAVRPVFEEEARCIELQSPVYVFGDIHGNLEDLHFFADNIWKLGVDLTAGKFLFLGDYVDRGLSCLECVAYLLSLKLLNPDKVFMLRGNHETRDVNGWEEHYGDKSFLYQCKKRFGLELGEVVWEGVNQVFDRLPLAGTIDKDIFCVHGGIPRLPSVEYTSEIAAINSVPTVAGIMPSFKHETSNTRQIATDCVWADPATQEQEEDQEYAKANGFPEDDLTFDAQGFGVSVRGGGVSCFSTQAINLFLERNKMSFIIRAHEAHAHGVAVSKGAKLFTVFSTSKDHHQGGAAMAGCILIDVDQIKVINRSPKYGNKYVHRRTSVALKGLTLDEFRNREKLGLIRNSVSPNNENAINYAILAAVQESESLDSQFNN